MSLSVPLKHLSPSKAFGPKSRGFHHFAQTEICRLLAESGITINGSHPEDIHIHDDRFFTRVFTRGSLGFGESYMDGWWDCDRIDVLMTKLLRIDAQKHLLSLWLDFSTKVIARLTNSSKTCSFQIGEAHYDLGNEFYQAMLDQRMIYSCAYWKDAANLDEAQQDKMDLICRKLKMKKGQRILDIGCGWGGLMKYAAVYYGVSAVGITVSCNQVSYGRQICAGLPIKIRYQDYHQLDEAFDHIVSVGMFEHVGYKNYRDFFEKAHHCLSDDGLFLLHTIGCLQTTVDTDPWIAKYIFPCSKLPSLKQITGACEDFFVVEDVHNFGVDYDRTLMAWHQNFEKHWPEFRDKYSQRFYRMWRYYLLICAASFRARKTQLWQIVLSRKGVKGGYESVR